jgi:hypothetical protein
MDGNGMQQGRELPSNMKPSRRVIVISLLVGMTTVAICAARTFFACKEDVRKEVTSPDNAYLAAITVCGGGALNSDTYHVRLRSASETTADQGEEVARAWRGTRVTSISWRDSRTLVIEREYPEYETSQANFEGADRWKEVTFAMVSHRR